MSGVWSLALSRKIWSPVHPCGQESWAPAEKRIPLERPRDGAGPRRFPPGEA